MKIITTDSWKYQTYQQPDISAIIRAIQREALEAAAEACRAEKTAVRHMTYPYLVACDNCAAAVWRLIPEEPKP